jgi:thiosulfate/3-mercaptopyruvate sulfurtransferase
MSGFAHPEYLVSTAWLADHLDDPEVRVFDVTARLDARLVNHAKQACYDQGHVPGAVAFDVASGRGVLSNPDEALPWMWPTPDQFVATMHEYGVGPDTRVILVAGTPRPGIDSGTMWCTRAWWTMHHMGVDVAIMHGGLERWASEGRPMTTEPTTPGAASGFVAADQWHRARATRDDVLAALEGPACIVDALPAESFDGTGTSYGPRSGHIEGAVNVPFRSLIDAETAAFVDADTMRATLSAAGLFDRASVITYCGGAIAATVDAFCLRLCGHSGVSVYDGSLMEWSADPDLPMA